jgi:hypothetical protein
MPAELINFGREDAAWWIAEGHSGKSLRLLQIGGEDHSLAQIFTLCVVVYGSLGLLWLVYLRLPTGDPRIENFRLGVLCASFCSCAIGMHVLNKSLASTLQAPSLITAAQMAICVAALGASSFKQLLDSPRKQLMMWLFVPGLFSAMLISGFYVYEYISLSLLTVVRNLAPLIALPVECMVMPPSKQPKVSMSVVMSILIMLAGALVYVGGLKEVSVLGISFAVFNMFLAVTERMTSRRLLSEECKDLDLKVCTIVNNALGMIPTLALAFMTQETAKAMQPEKAANWLDPRVLVVLLMSGAIGIGIGYFGFACQKAMSATSFMVLQNISKVAVVSMGIVIFADPIKSPFSVIGLLLSLAGSALYGKSQMDATAESKKLVEEAAEPAKSA